MTNSNYYEGYQGTPGPEGFDGSGFVPPGSMPINLSPEIKKVMDLLPLTAMAMSWWDAEKNIPKIYSDQIMPQGYYAKVTIPGKTEIKSFDKCRNEEIILTDWKPGEVIMSDGHHWFKTTTEILAGLGIN